jgi:hypothetical protein
MCQPEAVCYTRADSAAEQIGLRARSYLRAVNTRARSADADARRREHAQPRKAVATGAEALAASPSATAAAKKKVAHRTNGRKKARTTSSAAGLGQLTGQLSRDHLTVESALQVDLDRESVRLPLYKGTANVETVWYVLLDASDPGIAHDLGINYAPKLSNLAINDPEAVQTVTIDSPTPQANHFGPATVHFKAAPDFSPTRVAEPGPNGFPLAKFQPGAVARDGYSPFIRIDGSPTVYSAPIVATGDGPFDVAHHTNTGDRVLGVHIAGPSAPGKFRRVVGRPAVR